MAKAKSKKEIDKDIMYSKIMPTGLRKSGPEEPEEDAAAAAPAPAAAAPAPAAAAPAPAPAPASPAAVPAPAAPPAPARAEEPPQPAFFSRAGVKLKEKSPSVVTNLMEQLVADRLDAAFSKFNCCKCDKCRKDVAAIALNKLHPKYVVSEQDLIPDLVSQQTGTEVTTAIVQAIIQVRAHPRH